MQTHTFNFDEQQGVITVDNNGNGHVSFCIDGKKYACSRVTNFRFGNVENGMFYMLMPGVDGMELFKVEFVAKQEKTNG